MRAIHDMLKDLTQGAGYLNGGYAAIMPDGQVTAFVTGRVRPDGPLFTDPATRLRMASIAKAATARAACALSLQGKLPLEADILDILQWTGAPAALRKHAVTPRQLLAHVSGLTDHAGYLVDAGQSIMDFISEQPAAVSHHLPGSYFAYANINYILLGHVIEAAAQARFDRILQETVLAPAGIAGGYNWAGVPVAVRANRLALYQRHDSGLTIEADGDEADWQADLIWRGGQGHAFADYVPGRDTSLLSPHAGLRMNIIEAARLARFLADGSAAARLQAETTWQFDPVLRNGEDCDGLFVAFGLGLTIYHSHPRIPGNLIGHAGHALGFTGGIWHNRATGSSQAYFLTGGRDETAGLDTEAFYSAAELGIMQAL